VPQGLTPLQVSDRSDSFSDESGKSPLQGLVRDVRPAAEQPHRTTQLVEPSVRPCVKQVSNRKHVPEKGRSARRRRAKRQMIQKTAAVEISTTYVEPVFRTEGTPGFWQTPSRGKIKVLGRAIPCLAAPARKSWSQLEEQFKVSLLTIPKSPGWNSEPWLSRVKRQLDTNHEGKRHEPKQKGTKESPPPVRTEVIRTVVRTGRTGKGPAPPSFGCHSVTMPSTSRKHTCN